MISGKLRFLLVICCILVPMSVVAQQLTPAQRYKMNLRLLELVETYESSLRTSRSFPFSKSKRKFMSLYSNNKDLLVYSDIMDFRASDKISVTEYARQLEMRELLMSSLSNLSKGDYVFKDGKWHIALTMDKTMTYYVSNESRIPEMERSMVYFSSLDYYKQPYKITLHCSYDPATELARIESVDGGINTSVPMLSDGFLVVQRSDDKDSRFKIKGAPGDSLAFNSEGQAFVAKELIQSKHEDIVITADTIARAQTFSHVKLSYKTVHWRAKFRFATTLGSAFAVESNDALSNEKNSAMEIGVDFGYTFPLGKSSTIGLYSGLGLSMSTLNLKFSQPIEYGYRLSDAEGLRYNRQYTITSASEGIKYTDMVIPFYINLDHKLYDRLYLNWSVGAKFYVNSSIKINPYTIVGDVKAIYEDGSVVSEREVDAIGSVSGVYDHFLYPGSFSRQPVDMSIIGGIGLSYSIYKGRLLAFAKAGYEYGLAPILDASGSKYQDVAKKIYPMVYSGREKQNIATRSLLNCVSYKRQALWLEVGLTYKF